MNKIEQRPLKRNWNPLWFPIHTWCIMCHLDTDVILAPVTFQLMAFLHRLKNISRIRQDFALYVYVFVCVGWCFGKLSSLYKPRTSLMDVYYLDRSSSSISLTWTFRIGSWFSPSTNILNLLCKLHVKVQEILWLADDCMLNGWLSQSW